MMESLKQLLANKASSSPLIKGIRASQIVEAASAVLTKNFGDGILEFANPAYFKNGTLTLACLSTTVAQEIKLQESKIMREINDKIPGQNVVKIKYLI